MSEPKKFWLADSHVDLGNGQKVYLCMSHLEGSIVTGTKIEVIEYSAYERLERALEISKDKESQFKSTLEETMRVRDKAINKAERLERALEKSRQALNTFSLKANYPDYLYGNVADETLAEIEAITKGE